MEKNPEGGGLKVGDKYNNLSKPELQIKQIRVTKNVSLKYRKCNKVI